MTTLTFSVGCNSCGQVLPPLREIAETFFHRGGVACHACATEVDLWSAYLQRMRSGITPLDLAGFGARVTVTNFHLALHERREVDLGIQGVPADAVILVLNFSVSGNIFPIEVHGENSRRRWPGTKVWLYGAALPGRSPAAAEESLVLASAVWIHETDDAEAWLMMTDALEAAAAEKWVRAIPPAQSAYEIVSANVVRRWLSADMSAETLKQYVERELTSFATTNVWLPILARIAQTPPLKQEIRGQLNRLRALRNKIVHEGRTEQQISATEARELLVASIFGFEYVRLIRERLAG